MEQIREIQVYDDLVPEDILCDILDLVKSKGFQYGWKSNKNFTLSHWNLGFTKTGHSSQNRQDVKDELPLIVRRLWDWIQPLVLSDNPILLRAYCNAHTYGTEGYIHTDSDIADDRTAVIYLNKSWKGNWAGETLLFDKEEIIKAVIPKWKRLFVFPSFIKHVARSVSRSCPEARLVLVFKASKL